MPAMAQNKRIEILLGTYNGARYLPDQLHSLQDQSYHNWHLWVSDDGSGDATRSLLNAWSDRIPMTILNGPRRGVAQNYLSLIFHPDMPVDAPVALCDQDDIWLPHRLERALASLKECGDRPALYCGRTCLISATGTTIGPSPLPKRKPDFRGALVHNIVAGNTVVLNPAAMRLIRQSRQPHTASHHDWWLYLLLSGAGAKLLFDPEPVLFYRQHATNTVGAHRGIRAHMRRIRQLFDGTYRDWQDHNLTELHRRRMFLTAENRDVLGQFQSSTGKVGLSRTRLLRRLRITRQDRLSNLALQCAVVLGRV